MKRISVHMYVQLKKQLSMKNNVVFLINSLDGGGAERVASILLNHLANESTCYVILIENHQAYTLDPRIEIIHLHQSSQQNAMIKFLKLPWLALRLAWIIRKYRFKRVVSFLYRANYINLLSKFFINHEAIISERVFPSSMYSDKSLNSKISHFLIKILYPKADMIVSVSEAIKKDLKDHFGIQANQCVIYNPCCFITMKEKREKSHEQNFITIGSLTSRKNQALLIRAFAKLTGFPKLYILGKGEKESLLKELAKALNVEARVIFLGFDSMIVPYLSKANVFVSASLSEGFPNALLEALACGLPIISTDCLSGPREILAPKTDYMYQMRCGVEEAEFGMLVPINDLSAMQKAMQKFLDNPALCEYYSIQALRRARDFAIEPIIMQWRNVLEGKSSCVGS